MNSVIARSGVTPQSGAQGLNREAYDNWLFYHIVERIWYLLYGELPTLEGS
jgi:hypothetical protein